MSFLITPNNSELIPFKDHSYLVYKTDKGLNKKAFDRLMVLTEIKLSYYARVAILRIDLHPHSFTPDNKVITSFLTKQIKAFEKKYGCLVSYYFAREQNTSNKQHYHLALFFSGHQVNSPHNISQEIQKNWIAHSQGSIHFVEKPFYMVERGNKLSLKQAIYRLSYLVKNRTKENNAQIKSYGSSRLKYKNGVPDNDILLVDPEITYRNRQIETQTPLSSIFDQDAPVQSVIHMKIDQLTINHSPSAVKSAPKEDNQYYSGTNLQPP
jgi:cellobiose-specific phosphotransferase system component IIB